MASRTVQRRGLMVASFSTTLDVCAEKIGSGFRVLSEPFLQPGEVPPDVSLFVRLLGRIMVGHFQALLNRDRADIDERANDAAPRTERDEVTRDLHGKLVEFRQVSDVAFGEEYARTLVPITGRTANTPSRVHTQGEHTLERFRAAKFKKPKSKVPGLDPDLARWAKDLEPLVTKLGVLLGVIEKEKLRASESVLRKKEIMKDLDFLYSHGYAIVRGLLFLAGLSKAAKELPTLNRTRRSQRGPDPRVSGDFS